MVSSTQACAGNIEPGHDAYYLARLRPVLDQLKKTQALLIAQWQAESSYPAWVQTGIQECDDMQLAHVETGIKAREQSIQLLNTWEYQDHQIPGSTLHLPGLIGGSAAMLALVLKMNEHRKALQAELQTMDQFALSNRPSGMVQADWVRSLLQQAGYARLNRRQVCRQWVVIDTPLSAASFIWNRCRKTERITAEEAERMVRKKAASEKSNPKVWQEDLNKIACLNPNNPNDDLIRVKTETLTRRVNLQDEVGKTKQRYAHSPILFLSGEKQALPRVRPLPQHIQGKHDRLRHRDIMFEEAVYINSLNAYRLA